MVVKVHIYLKQDIISVEGTDCGKLLSLTRISEDADVHLSK